MNRSELMNIEIQHHKQPDSQGCMYYSYYSLTNDNSLLIYADDNSPFRFSIRVISKGFHLWTVYKDDINGAQNDVWINLQDKLIKEKVDIDLKLLSTIKVTPKRMHTFAVQGNFVKNYFKIADPGKGDLMEGDINILTKLPYSNPVEIQCLDSLEVKDYPMIDKYGNLIRDT